MSFTNLKIYYLLLILSISCNNKDKELPSLKKENNVTLHFNNTFKEKTIVLDKKNDNVTVNISKAGQTHQFSELKYIISNIRLVDQNKKEIAYHTNNLNKGATIINHKKLSSCDYILKNIPKGNYVQLKFGLGIQSKLNILDQEKFPEFYAKADAYEAKMMWYWGKGYRFLKIEGIYSEYNQKLSIHTGSTLVDGIKKEDPAYIQGVDAYKEIILDLPNKAIVGETNPIINIRADFDKLLSGDVHTITLVSGNGQYTNATPNGHSSKKMEEFLDNLGYDNKGIFSIESIKN